MDSLAAERKMLFKKSFKEIVQPILLWTVCYLACFVLVFGAGIVVTNPVGGIMMFVAAFSIIKLLWQFFEYFLHRRKLDKYLKEKYMKQ